MEQDVRSSTLVEATELSTDPVAWDQHVEPASPGAGESIAATIAALADPATRSPEPDTCPFLRTIDVDGGATPPIERPDPANRCVAMGEPMPQSSRQQELVCLTAGHNNCPRYLRGRSSPPTPSHRPREQSGPSVPGRVRAAAGRGGVDVGWFPAGPRRLRSAGRRTRGLAGGRGTSEPDAVARRARIVTDRERPIDAVLGAAFATTDRAAGHAGASDTVG